MIMTIVSPRRRQLGSSLLEGLIAIAIFSVGVLGLVGMQARMLQHSGDSKYRADAADLANQIIGQMWADRANLAAYSHYGTGGAGTCSPGGAPSANATVTSWTAAVQNALPGAPANNQQISVGPNNAVTVTVCWKGPADTASHNYVASAQING